MKKIFVLFSLALPLLALAACNRDKPTRETVTTVTAANADDDDDGDDIHGNPAKMAGHPAMGGKSMGGKSTGAKAPPAKVDVGKIKKADGGQTVAEIISGKANFKDKKVTVRGKVVKYTPQVLGKSWLHIQDGSGDPAAKTHDLTVTTTGEVKKDDTVLVTGELHLDKDFGAGYKYDLIVEDAKVVVE